MDLVYQNPFRVLGIPVNATDREIEKQIGNISIYAEMGKTINLDTDQYFSIQPTRTAQSIQEAKQKIDQPNNKLFYSLFWFWEKTNNTIDDMAFEELKNSNFKKAIEFWERGTAEGITSKNKSNHKNLSVLLLGLSLLRGDLVKKHFLKSLSLSGEFLSNGHFEEFTRQILGARHSVNLMETTSQYADSIILIAKPYIDKKQKILPSGRLSNKGTTSKELLHHFEAFPESIQNDILEKFVGKHFHNIDRQIEKCEQTRQNDRSKANKAGFNLFKNIEEDLEQLQSVFTKSDLKYHLVADKLAEELLDCSIAYFNEYYDSNTDPGDDALKLLKYAKKIAVGDKIKDRITDNQPNIEKYVAGTQKRRKLKPVKSDFDFIYGKLENFEDNPISIQTAGELLFSCINHLEKIKDELGQIDGDYLDISTSVALYIQSKIIDIVNDAMNKYNKYIKYTNSIYYRKIIEETKILSSEQLISTAPEFAKTYTVEELKDVINQAWKITIKLNRMDVRTETREKLNSNKNSLKEIRKANDIHTTSSSSSSSSNSSGCYIATMVYGSYDAPEVLVLRDFRDRILLKSQIGKMFVNTYYKYSPKFVELTKDIKIVHTIFRNILDGFIELLKGLK